MGLYKVKICCIKNLEEAQLAIQLGATTIGLVGHMPSGPGIISDDMIATIADQVKGTVETILLTSETSAQAIIKHHKKVNTSAIQIVDHIAIEDYQIIKNALPDIRLIQVVHVMNEDTIKEARRLSKYVDYILLDSGYPNLPVKQLGGTGQTHNWDISQRIVESIDTPVFLAGGLNHNNVKEAIEKVKPYGVDVCSGVRTDGSLDQEKLIAFFNAIGSTSL